MDAFVSGMTRKLTSPKNELMISVIHMVQRHPRCDFVTKPPMIGPATGPANVAPAKTLTATALFTGSQKSASAPPTIESGAAEKRPPKNLQTRMVCMFDAIETGIWKIQPMAYAMKRGRFLPYNSEQGPHINGPMEKP